MTATLVDPYILHVPCKDKFHGKWGGELLEHVIKDGAHQG